MQCTFDFLLKHVYIYGAPLSLAILITLHQYAGVIILGCFFTLTHTYAFINKRVKLPRSWKDVSKEDVALVTGGSRGLGKQIVEHLLVLGIGKVIILDLSEPPLKDSRLQYYKCDLNIESELSKVIDEIIASETVTLVVNNAGQRHSESLLNLSNEKIKRIFNINFFAQVHILQKVLHNHIHKVLPSKPNSRCFVVTVSSILGVFAPRNLSMYAASKAATIQLHDALTEELRSYPTIRLLLVTPGQLNTDMFGDVNGPWKFFAPIVDSNSLAMNICTRFRTGEVGTLSEPLYAKFLPLVRSFPFSLQKLARKVSLIDEQIEDNSTINAH